MPIIPSPLGNIQLSIREECLSELKFTQQEVEGELLEPLLLETQKQLKEYFAGKRQIAQCMRSLSYLLVFQFDDHLDFYRHIIGKGPHTYSGSSMLAFFTKDGHD